jgi:lantibiotic biosynthesis protein
MSEFFETAQSIGARLCRDAIWSGDRCNWVGASMEALQTWTVVQKSFGPDLYAGTGGIGILLAELAAFNHERIFRRTAEGAAAHAFAHAEKLPSFVRLAFYSGQVGVGYSLIRIGERLGAEEWVSRGLKLLDAAATVDVREQGTDVISGVAGTIPVLLLVHERYGRPAFVDLAIRCAEKLEKSANRSDDGYSWNTIGTPGQEQRDLTGFSHGTAGIGWAMLELEYATGDKRFRAIADQAFRYERHWFSSEKGNWPDFRSGPTPNGSAPEPGYSVGWCHGAPGIGFSRLRAFELTSEGEFAVEARVAAATTMRYFESPQTYQSSYSLCHGAAGNADFLLEASLVLGESEYRECAERAARQGIAWFEAARAPWPCGVLGGGETPNLLLGTAGIALFYLRLEDPSQVKTVLMVGPRPGSFSASSIA